MGRIIFLLLQILRLALSDVYLHSPRGSNNRLDGSNRNRGNANRLFDSQNNDRGGYNVGTDGSMYYYAGSIVPIEWTNQHSCSDPNNHCELILQYMCSPALRDGRSRSTIPESNFRCMRRNCSLDTRFGMHEDVRHYLKCKTRPRNANLFTADQNLRGSSAIYTRQNPNGQRRGLECPEERDYYPYWAPSPWKDIAILTSDTSRCSYYKQESQNVKDRYECVVPDNYLETAARRRWTIPNNKASCEKLGRFAKWVKAPAHGIPPPECIKASWSRDNHNGNGMGGYPNMYNWTVPNLDGACALRIRYNISTNDFDNWATDAKSNGKNPTKVNVAEKLGISCLEGKERGYVYKNDPEVRPLPGNIGNKMKLRLAINTAQFGRTFEDRSHMFNLTTRPEYLEGKKIYNVNVRGKRGNIVQVYPAVEYDYVPNVLTVGQEDYVHFQWTGSDRNPNNNDGQGRRGTDRSNVVLLTKTKNPEGNPKIAYPTGKYGHWGSSYPEKLAKTYFLGQSMGDLRNLAFVDPGVNNRNRHCRIHGRVSELDGAPSYFDLGPQKATSVGTFHYFCTRNNNFSNRSQKGKIIVKKASTGKASGDMPNDPSCNGMKKSEPEPSNSKDVLSDNQITKKENAESEMQASTPGRIEEILRKALRRVQGDAFKENEAPNKVDDVGPPPNVMNNADKKTGSPPGDMNNADNEKKDNASDQAWSSTFEENQENSDMFKDQ